jgi:tRNA A-37 threonylcarbamoyl transferase component Bud32/tetratricopeptide (TPR) repeat protein
VRVVGSDEPLIGRDAELAVIAEVLDGIAGARRAVTVQITGAPGIGKSALLGALCAEAQARGYLVLAGRSAEFEAELPFGVFSDAIDDWLESLEPDRLAALAGDAAGLLGAVFPAFEALARDRTPGPGEERFRAYRAVRALLSSLAEDAPVILALDDVQWADPASVELVCHLLAHPPRGRVLIALGFRPAQLSAPLSAALAGALRVPAAARLDLGPLTSAAAGELLGPDLSESVRDVVLRDSGGNPFFLLQLARSVTRADRARPASVDGSSSVPGAVRAALASELSSLPVPALLFLQGAAVVGDPFDLLVATCAAGVGETDAGDLIDTLLEFQLVYPTAGHGRFAFRHPIVRATVYESIGTAWRAGAHARVASLLAARGASAAARAPHLERSARPGDAKALAALVEAGAASAPRAPALAARWYAAALRVLPDGAEAEPQRIELTIAMAAAMRGAGQFEESRSALCEVLERLPAGDAKRVAVVAICAEVEGLLGRHGEARIRLSQAHRELRDRGSEEAVTLKIRLAVACCYEARMEDMRSWAEEALELGHEPYELVGTALSGFARYALGVPAEDVVDRAGALFDAIDDAELAMRLQGAKWLVWAETLVEHYGRAIDHCRRAMEVSRATGEGTYLLSIMTALAWSQLYSGRIAEAEETLAAAIESFSIAPNHFFFHALGIYSVVAAYRGDLAGAVNAGDECMRLGGLSDPGVLRMVSGSQVAVALLEAGETQRAHDTVLATAPDPSGAVLVRPAGTAGYEILTRAAIAQDDVEAAVMWAKRAEALIPPEGLAVETIFARRAMAAATLAQGDAPQAVRIALEAAACADAADSPAEAGRCRLLAARALMEVGERDRAITELEAAADGLARAGAHLYVAEAESELRRLGCTVKQRASTPSSGGGRRSTTRAASARDHPSPAQPDRAARDLAPGDLFAGYRIEALAGRGGMGLVYKARQERPARTVALKVIAPELAGEGDFRARFEQEARLAAEIEHPNVIPIYDVGEAGGLLYIAMRFVASTDLRVLLRSHERLAPGHAAGLVTQIASALDAAHALGLVHRDVKPANVLVTGAHPDEHVYLTDFGLTKRIAASSAGITMTGRYVGTVDYIAPEQVSGDPVDARADIYALGCVLYQLLTGVVPFPRDQDIAKIFAHVSIPPPRASTIAPGVPVDLDAAVARAMAKDPADRFGSAGEFARTAAAAAAAAAAADTAA